MSSGCSRICTYSPGSASGGWDHSSVPPGLTYLLKVIHRFCLLHTCSPTVFPQRCPHVHDCSSTWNCGTSPAPLLLLSSPNQCPQGWSLGTMQGPGAVPPAPHSLVPWLIFVIAWLAIGSLWCWWGSNPDVLKDCWLEVLQARNCLSTFSIIFWVRIQIPSSWSRRRPGL